MPNPADEQDAVPGTEAAAESGPHPAAADHLTDGALADRSGESVAPSILQLLPEELYEACRLAQSVDSTTLEDVESILTVFWKPAIRLTEIGLDVTDKPAWRQSAAELERGTAQHDQLAQIRKISDYSAPLENIALLRARELVEKTRQARRNAAAQVRTESSELHEQALAEAAQHRDALGEHPRDPSDPGTQDPEILSLDEQIRSVDAEFHRLGAEAADAKADYHNAKGAFARADDQLTDIFGDFDQWVLSQLAEERQQRVAVAARRRRLLTMSVGIVFVVLVVLDVLVGDLAKAIVPNALAVLVVTGAWAFITAKFLEPHLSKRADLRAIEQLRNESLHCGFFWVGLRNQQAHINSAAWRAGIIPVDLIPELVKQPIAT